MFYVIEIQTNGDTGSVIPVAFVNREDAEAKYHEVLMYASKSNVPKHGAMICTADLFIIKSEVYNHEIEPVEASDE